VKTTGAQTCLVCAVADNISKNNYNGAIEKLTNDILKKLDADGRADWVNEPTLLGEIKALIGILKSRARI
jgi:hypothetical protein